MVHDIQIKPDKIYYKTLKSTSTSV